MKSEKSERNKNQFEEEKEVKEVKEEEDSKRSVSHLNLPITFQKFQNYFKNQLENDEERRIYWIIITSNNIKEKEINEITNQWENALKRYNYFQKIPENETILTWHPFEVTNIGHSVLNLIQKQLDIPNIQLIIPFILIITKTIPNEILCFSIVYNVLQRSIPWYFKPALLNHRIRLEIFRKITLESIPKTNQVLLEVHALDENILNEFFVYYFSHLFIWKQTQRIMDWYLLNGEKGLYCCVLAIYKYYKHQFKAHLFTHHSHNHNQNQNDHENDHEQNLSNINHTHKPELFFKSGVEWIQYIKKECEENSFNYAHFWELVHQNHSIIHKGVPKRHTLNSMYSDIDHQIRSSSNWDSPLSLLPHTLSLQVNDSIPSPTHHIPSTILTPSTSSKLQSYLQQFHLSSLSQFNLIYSTDLYGYALQSLYRRVDLLSPIIILIKCHEKYSSIKVNSHSNNSLSYDNTTIDETAESISIKREDTMTITPSYHHEKSFDLSELERSNSSAPYPIGSGDNNDIDDEIIIAIFINTPLCVGKLCGDEKTFICRLDSHSDQLYKYHQSSSSSSSSIQQQQQQQSDTFSTPLSSTHNYNHNHYSPQQQHQQQNQQQEIPYNSNSFNCYCHPNYLLVGYDSSHPNTNSTSTSTSNFDSYQSPSLSSYSLRLDYTLQSFTSNFSSSFQSTPIIPEKGNDLVSISTVEVLCDHESIIKSGILINQIDKYMSFTPMDQDGNFLELSHTGSFLLPTAPQKHHDK